MRIAARFVFRILFVVVPDEPLCILANVELVCTGKTEIRALMRATQKTKSGVHDKCGVRIVFKVIRPAS
jgi:hypothetical protein